MRNEKRIILIVLILVIIFAYTLFMRAPLIGELAITESWTDAAAINYATIWHEEGLSKTKFRLIAD